jgi:hypothetical protein
MSLSIEIIYDKSLSPQTIIQNGCADDWFRIKFISIPPTELGEKMTLICSALLVLRGGAHGLILSESQVIISGPDFDNTITVNDIMRLWEFVNTHASRSNSHSSRPLETHTPAHQLRSDLAQPRRDFEQDNTIAELTQLVITKTKEYGCNPDFKPRKQAGLEKVWNYIKSVTGCHTMDNLTAEQIRKNVVASRM